MPRRNRTNARDLRRAAGISAADARLQELLERVEQLESDVASLRNRADRLEENAPPKVHRARARLKARSRSRTRVRLQRPPESPV